MQLKWKLRLPLLSGAHSLNKMQREWGEEDEGWEEGTEGRLCGRGWQLKRQALAEGRGRRRFSL